MDSVAPEILRRSKGELREKNTWKPLAFLNAYRLTVSGLFLILTFTDNLFAPLASQSRELFLGASAGYFFFGILGSMSAHWRTPEFEIQVRVGVIADVVFVSLLMHASGGVQSGVGMLMFVSVAGGSILTAGRTAMSFAAIATLGILAEQFYRHIDASSATGGYAQAGLLGVSFFTAALIVHVLAQRIRESEDLARKRGIDLANMAELTGHIIQRMQTGILVVDPDNRVRLINESAWYMLGMPATGDNALLADISAELADQVKTWLADINFNPPPFQPNSDYSTIVARLARISPDERPGVLIFLEDTAAMAQQAQQLKLASLGRLTASIAHEIRNPLGAISHAGQLLDESPHLDQADQRLTRIISDQSARMNGIVENVMSLSRRDRAKPEVFELKPFLQQFVDEFAPLHEIDSSQFVIDIEPADLQVQFDRSQLQQILTNLCENGLRHSSDYTGGPRIEFRGGVAPEFRRPYLDVIDHGPGLTAETAEHIFEPFFTTEATGTGLGLYISRELAESNQSNINYLPAPTGGSCFRIRFQDPRKHIS
jgi:two-component system sensor histidine kinase PilS (NtrC family)